MKWYLENGDLSSFFIHRKIVDFDVFRSFVLFWNVDCVDDGSYVRSSMTRDSACGSCCSQYTMNLSNKQAGLLLKTLSCSQPT